MSDTSNVVGAGFGASGVGKDTPASGMQSDLGDVKPGSNFSHLQTTGATSGQPAGNSTSSAGFGPPGVSAGSPAARVQSDIGNVSKGSNFSDMQSGKKN